MMDSDASFPALDCKIGELTELGCRFHVKRLEIFGSATTSAFRPESSALDFVVDFGDQPLGPWGSLFLGFADALEALFGRHVDLISCNRFETRISGRPSMPHAGSSVKLEAKKLLFDLT